MPAAMAAEENPFAGEDDNPFGGGAFISTETQPTQPLPKRAPAAAVEEPLVRADTPAATRLLIRSVKQSKPETPTELARAVDVLLNLKQYTFAQFYFSQLDAAVQTDTQRVDLVQQMGSDFFLALHATRELAPAGQAFARELLAVGKQAAQSPQAIATLIGKLNDQDIAIRSRAFRNLRRIGPNAIAAMIELFADADRADEFPGLRGAMQSLDAQAIPLLLGAARASNLSVRSEAIRALSFYRGQPVRLALQTAAVNPATAPRVRQAAIDSLARMRMQVPNSSDVASQLRQQATALLTGRQQVGGNLIDTTTTWAWDASTNTLQPNNSTVATASRFQAARLANDLYLIERRPDHRELYLLTQLEVAKRLAGSARTVTAASFTSRLLSQAGTVTTRELNRLLERAVAWKTIPAAIACCELLAESDDAEIFRSPGGRMCPVIQAIMLGDRHLQHAALTVIDRVNPTYAYAGSSHAVTLAVFLANSYQNAAGLVGHHQIERAQRLAGSLGAAGLAGKAAGSSREFFARATVDPDISLLLISDTLVRPRFDELIRQLRADFRTAQTPIGLIVRDEASRRRVAYLIANDPLTRAFPAAIDGELLASYLRSTADVEDVELSSLSDDQRYEHAFQAIQWLNKISSDRPQLGFYELGRHQEQLAALLYVPGFADDVAKLLANLGTPLAQRELANFASQRTLPSADRQVAATALSRSIKDGRTLLTKEQVRQQYLRYNASESDTPANQQILGSILDAIETRAGKQTRADK